MDRSLPLDRRFSTGDYIAFLLPPAIVLAFFITYLVSPAAYLKYVLSFVGRETETVEILTWVSALVAAIILLPVGVALWRRMIRDEKTWLPGGALFIVIAGLAAFFFAGEELSWGQTWFHWKTPTEMNGISRETNLHNGSLGRLVHAGGNSFLIGLFILGPILWKFRRKLPVKIPKDWKPSVAEWPVLTTMVLAFLMRLPKLIFMMTHNDAQLHASTFYEGYLEEINEQKEMLVAMGLLIYAIYRIRAARKARDPIDAE